MRFCEEMLNPKSRGLRQAPCDRPRKDLSMQSTQRLAIEPLTEHHADELYEGFSHDRLYPFIPERPPRSIEAMRAEYKEFSEGAPEGSGEIWLNWAVRESANGGLVGKLQATVFADGLLWIGYKFVLSASGRGLATEAVQWLVDELAARLPHKAVMAAVDTRNDASTRVLQKCGFELLRTEAAEIHGEPSEDFIFRFPPAIGA